MSIGTDILNKELNKLKINDETTKNNSKELNDLQCKANFLFLNELGVGSYSTVYLCSQRETSRRFAIKVCSKRQIIREKKVDFKLLSIIIFFEG